MKLGWQLGVIALVASISSAALGDVTLTDPKGDDNGDGKIVYPTGKVYKRGSFDLTELSVKDDGDDYIFTARFATKVLDPWQSKDWDGNGFSLQYVQVYIDTKKGTGNTRTLPGINAEFSADAGWNKVVVLSPQGKSRLKAEVNTKAASVKGDVVIPRKTRAKGKTIRGIVSKKDIGDTPLASWGIQALVQSNEGFPSPSDLLTRKVNQVQGEHRFGGGNDWDCDAQVIDMFAGAAKGDDSEKAAQHKALTDYCGGDGMRDKSDGKLPVLPMVYISK